MSHHDAGLRGILACMTNPVQDESRSRQTIADVLKAMQAGSTTSSALLATALARIADPAGEGSRTFLQVYPDSAATEAQAADSARHDGLPAGPLAGVPISVKDLFDIHGQSTTAGSRVLQGSHPAARDAEAVRRLRAAGAVIVGRTNMTEFAYSGVGLNPHYGTPRNPYRRDAALIPGGSSSGAAVSVSDGMAVAAVGSDTGGSVRIPAALCGLVGFKPTARRVPMTGMVPLAPSLDSVGPIGHSVDCCDRMHAVLSGGEYRALPAPDMRFLRLGVLQGYVLDGLDDAVRSAYGRALDVVTAAGAHVEPIHFAALARIPASNQSAATEAYGWHRHLLDERGRDYDPHVSARILHGAGVLAADYLELQRVRRELIAEYDTAVAGFDAVLMPTVPRIAPPIADLEASDDVYFDVNGAMLRNTSIVNFLDGCALSLPCHRGGEAPVGLMVAGTHGNDVHILRVGRALEAALQSAAAS